MRGTAILLLATSLTACSNEPTVIDGSTPKSFARTAEKARRDLPIKDRLTFDTAIRTVGGRRYADKDPDATAREIFNGMTAQEVVEDAHARGIE